MAPKITYNKIQTPYRDLIRFAWFAYFSDSSSSTLIPHSLPSSYSDDCFVFEHTQSFFSFSQYLNFFSSVWNALPPNSSPFQHWGSNSNITSLEHLSPAILTKEASIVILYCNILCRRSDDCSANTFYHFSSTGGVYFLSPMLLGLARWIVMTNLASWL